MSQMLNIRKKLFFVLGISFLLILVSCSTSHNMASYNTGTSTENTTAVPKQIALLLPLSGPMAGPGQAVRDGFMNSYYQALQSGQVTTKVRVYNTMQGDIERLYEQAILDGADCIVGPLEKEKVQRMARSPLPVTTIALNYIGKSYQGSTNLYQFGLSPLDEATQAAQFAYQRGQRSALIIAPTGPWGLGVVQAFRNQWRQLGGQVNAQFFYAPNQDLSAYVRQVLQVNEKAEANAKLVRQPMLVQSAGRRVENAPTPALRRQDVDMVFLVAQPPKARQINPLLKFYYAGDLPVYSISLVYSGIPSPAADQDLNGIMFDDMPWVFNPTASKLSHFPRLYALGRDAFTVVMKRQEWKYSPSTVIQGYTGELSLGSNNQIMRKLVWAQFDQGEVHTID